MKANLYIRYSDLEKYLRGEGIEAAPRENKSHIFEYTSNQELLEVSVDVSEIVACSEVTKRGFVSGTFTYYTIQGRSPRD